ncbi:hypothetical protein LguiA_006102 [Lonicera macranthoides]
MASLKALLTLYFTIIAVTCLTHAHAKVEETAIQLVSEALDLPMSDTSLYDGEFGDSDARRSLFWKRVRYYISYGALSANRIPCPPRSGRSYYTHNCYKARGQVHPYTRGCSTITRCRR